MENYQSQSPLQAVDWMNNKNKKQQQQICDSTKSIVLKIVLLLRKRWFSIQDSTFKYEKI